jgi:ZIP family zinc transporter
MDDILLVIIISCVAALLAYLGAPLAERFEVPHQIVSAALQFADGIITGLLLALGLSISTMPLAFVTIATAKKQGMSKRSRSMLAYLFMGCIIGGALLGYGLLRNQPLEIRLVLIALASGFLITLVTQSMIPEANREGEPGFAGILYMGGLSLYRLMSLTAR